MTKVYSGIASDYVRHLNKQLNIKMVPVLNLSWSEVMNKARAWEFNVLPCSLCNIRVHTVPAVCWEESSAFGDRGLQPKHPLSNLLRSLLLCR